MRILVLKDDRSGIYNYGSVLEASGCEVVDVMLLQETTTSLRRFNADAVVIDISKKDCTGLEEFTRLQGQNRYMSFVIHSVHSDTDLATEFIKRGAQDYLVKGSNDSYRLLQSLRFSFERNKVALGRLLRKDRLKLVLEDSFDAFISMNSELSITEWNSKAETTFDRKPEDVLGRSISIITPQHLRKQFLKNIQNFFEDHDDRFLKTTREIIAQRSSGKNFAAEFTVYRLVDENSPNYYAYLRDISKEKKTKEQLELLVDKRTEELSRSNDELEQFAKIASHDLQEPLRAIEGFAHLLKKGTKGKLNKDCKEFLEYIIDGTQRMKQLIQSILIHSQISASESIDQVTNCNSVVSSVLDSLQHIIESTGATFEIDYLPEVPVEKSQVIQLFQNLISNSIKFRSERPLVVTINSKLSMDHWIFAFKDNGIGIEPEYAGNIFDMFSRIHSKEIYPGTGMGLAICKRIITTHGGSIWVESEPGEGCRFLFTLPSINNIRNINMRNKIEILLVEDTASDIRLTQEALKESEIDYSLVIKNDGAEAMEYLYSLKNVEKIKLPDIILLDLNMPKMNGHQVLEAIKADPILRSIPVILLTVSERDEDVLEALSTKMNYYMPKPVTTEKFSLLIKAIAEVNSLVKDISPKTHTKEETHIRLVLAGNPHTSEFALSKLAEAEEDCVRCRVARNAKIPPEIQMILSRDRQAEVRLSLCENTSLMTSILDMLASDRSDDVRLAVSKATKVSTRVLEKLAEDENVFVADSAKKALAYRT
ncbi:response regulator [bacterium]|nr:response regulator [bacterium]